MHLTSAVPVPVKGILIGTLLVAICKRSATGSELEKALFRSLFKNYDSTVRPVRNSSKAVLINFAVTIIGILDVNERNQIFSTNLWVNWVWQDDRLSWNERLYSRPAMRLHVDFLWSPDIILYNKADDFNSAGYKRVNTVVHSNGTVFWLPPVVMRSSCPIDIFHFPFDIQICPLKFGSWSYDSSQLIIHLLTATADQSAYLPNGEWRLVTTRLERHMTLYKTDNRTYGDITLHFCIKRRSLYYWTNVVAPSTCLNVLCLASFGMPSGANGKVGLSISIMLSYFVYTNAISERLPRSSTLPAIGIYLFASLILAVISVTFAVVAVHYKKSRYFSWKIQSSHSPGGSVLMTQIMAMRQLTPQRHGAIRRTAQRRGTRYDVIDSFEDDLDLLSTTNENEEESTDLGGSECEARYSLAEMVNRIEEHSSDMVRHLCKGIHDEFSTESTSDKSRFQRVGDLINHVSFALSLLLLSSVLVYITYMHYSLEKYAHEICNQRIDQLESETRSNPNNIDF